MTHSAFTLLRDPATYVACTWDLGTDEPARVHWVNFFKSHFRTLLSLGKSELMLASTTEAAAARACQSAARDLDDLLNAYAENPLSSQWGRVTILTLDRWRDDILRRHGIVDAFASLKQRENETAFPLLGGVMDMHAATARGVTRMESLVRGVFAGNIFDMGAEATAGRFLAGSVAFSTLLSEIRPRPWRLDDFDTFAARWAVPPAKGGWRKIVYFIDNAGSDFMLGALPLIAEWLTEGRDVVIAANERPSLNDMTTSDVLKWWPRLVSAVPVLGRARVVSTGTGEPLIDLSAVSQDLNTAAAGAELVVLEGMGRGVESNLEAQFRCDALNIAILKDRMIASRVGGVVYDCVCRFRPFAPNVR